MRDHEEGAPRHQIHSPIKPASLSTTTIPAAGSPSELGEEEKSSAIAGAAKLIITITAAPVRTILLIDLIIFELLFVALCTPTASEAHIGSEAPKRNRSREWSCHQPIG